MESRPGPTLGSTRGEKVLVALVTLSLRITPPVRQEKATFRETIMIMGVEVLCRLSAGVRCEVGVYLCSPLLLQWFPVLT